MNSNVFVAASILGAVLLGCGSSEVQEERGAQAAPECGILRPGQFLAHGESVSSCNGAAVLVHGGDGNVVLYHNGAPIWDTRTAGRPTATFNMQGDGNVTLVRPDGSATWSTGTWRYPG